MIFFTNVADNAGLVRYRRARYDSMKCLVEI
jgi:hypothetical protein